MGIWKTIKKAWTDAYDEVVQREQAKHAQDDRPLMERINDSEQYSWTEEELNVWLNTLDEPVRRQAIASAKKLMGLGEDPIDFLCKLRIHLEAKQRDREAEERASAPTLGGLLWAYDEARLMGAQREFFDRENKKARGW